MKNRNTSNSTLLTGLTILSLLASQTVSASIIENTIDTLGLSEPIALSYGDHTIKSGISPGVDLDSYTFQGRTGDSVRIVVAGHSNNYDPFIEIRNPTGVVLQTQSCSGGSSISFSNCSTFLDQELSNNGTYFVNISDSGNNEAGNYTLHLDQYPPSNNWDGLAYNDALTTLLGHAGDHDFLAFNGVTGTGVKINVEGNSNNLDPHLQIWDPLGTLIADDACSGGSSISFSTCSFSTELNLSESGLYKMGVFDSGFNETGSYSLNLGCVFGSCPSDAPNPVPVPAAVWLFASGLAGLRLVSREKKLQD